MKFSEQNKLDQFLTHRLLYNWTVHGKSPCTTQNPNLGILCVYKVESDYFIFFFNNSNISSIFRYPRKIHFYRESFRTPHCSPRLRVLSQGLLQLQAWEYAN